MGRLSKMTLMATDKMKAETTMGKLDFNNKQEQCNNKKKKQERNLCAHVTVLKHQPPLSDFQDYSKY